MKWRILSMVLAAVLALSLTACGGGQTTNDHPSESNAPEVSQGTETPVETQPPSESADTQEPVQSEEPEASTTHNVNDEPVSLDIPLTVEGNLTVSKEYTVDELETIRQMNSSMDGLKSVFQITIPISCPKWEGEPNPSGRVGVVIFAPDGTIDCVTNLGWTGEGLNDSEAGLFELRGDFYSAYYSSIEEYKGHVYSFGYENPDAEVWVLFGLINNYTTGNTRLVGAALDEIIKQDVNFGIPNLSPDMCLLLY